MNALTTYRILIVCLCACGASERRFPLRAPLERDTDLKPVHVKCRDHGCAPKEYKSPLYWDVIDNSVFRPTSEALAVRTSRESVNVNSLDEVPDSAWFQNRIGRRPVTAEELALGGCTRDQLLDPDQAPDGSWVVDGGRDGSTPGFRIDVPGKGKYYVKLEVATKQPERQSAAAVIGSAVMHAAGYNVACEQLLYVRPSVFRLKPGLTYKSRFLGPEPYDRDVFAAELARATKRDGLIRISASAWLTDHVIGPYRFIGTRDDDPNDVVPHEDRRELRGMRVLAAWLERHDAREMNTLDVWVTDTKGPKASSPGHVVHYQIDTSDTLGAPFGGKPTSRIMGKSYLFDWTNITRDLLTLGIPRRPWDDAKVTPGHELFGYFNARDFVPELWKPEYPNPAFSRMTERDGAWMARILARFTPDLVQALAEMGNFTDPAQTKYLASVLQGRLDKILRRYLTSLSPIADLRVEEGKQLCGVNLAEWRGLRRAASFRYRARVIDGRALSITRRPEGGVCVMLDHIARDGGARDDDPSRYVRVAITDGVSRGPLVAHLYDLGPARGFYLAGIERR